MIGRIILGAALAATLPKPGVGQTGEASAYSDVGLLWLPDGTVPSAPVPLVIALHDSLGIDQRGWRYSERITAAGLAVLHVELQDVSADGVTNAPARDDAEASLDRLAAAIDMIDEDPRFARGPVGILAFGAAGQVALRVTAARPFAERIAATALLYPGCATIPAPAPEAAPQSPVLLLHGDADPANSPADCEALAARIGRSAPVRRRQYTGAAYAWDLPAIGSDEAWKLPWPGRPGMRVPASYWPEATDFSADHVAGFFAARLASRP